MSCGHAEVFENPAYCGGIARQVEFGIDGDRWVPLHASIEGWIESVALAHHASNWSRQITTIRGDAIDGLPLSTLEPVTEVRGMADTW